MLVKLKMIIFCLVCAFITAAKSMGEYFIKFIILFWSSTENINLGNYFWDSKRVFLNLIFTVAFCLVSNEFHDSIYDLGCDLSLLNGKVKKKPSSIR